MSTKVSDYNYHLPKEQIAQRPIEPRDHSRLMVVDRKGKVEDKKFYDILDYLKAGDVLVRNTTKVIPARLVGVKETGAILEVFLLKQLDSKRWECLLGNAKKLKLGQRLIIGEGKLIATLEEIKEDGNRVLNFEYEGIFEEILDSLGEMPLPPYITEKLTDNNRYQTVYAKKGESVAAPTAGLHFTKELLDKIAAKGIEILDVYLNVGLGTFRPVQVEDLSGHKMHKESYYIPKETIEKVTRAKEDGRRIIAVGTTTVRTLESYGKTRELEGDTEIFIYPGFKFEYIDGMITNFHLPKSTLLMLVSAFSSREYILDIYNQAVEKDYRFFSFGDSMFLY